MRLCSTLLLLIDVSSLLPAQQEADSLFYAVPEVIVKGSGVTEAASRSAAFAKDIDMRELSHLSGMPIDRALRRSGLVYVRARGGRASVTTVGLRGFSASQTNVTLNGFSMVNQQNGIVDMGLYPLEVVKSISIVRGAQSAFTGSGGMGGSMNLVTHDAESGSFVVRGGMGSHGYRSASLVIPVRPYGVPISVQTGLVVDDGSYGYDAMVSGDRKTGERQGNASSLLYSLIVSRTSVGASSLLSGMVYLAGTRRGSPGPVSLQVPVDATLSDRIARAGLRIVTRTGPVLWEGELSAVYHWERFQDATLSLPVDNSYINTGITAAIRSISPLTSGAQLTAGIEAGQSGIHATTVPFPQGRFQGAAFAAVRFGPLSGGTVVYPSVRIDLASDLRPAPSWKIALHQPVLRADVLVLRAGIGTGFRYPSFNERYWVPGGNPGLRRESSFMIEGGISSAFRSYGEHTLMLMAHVSEVNDKIVGWPPVNAERTRLLGSDAVWTWIPTPFLELHAGASWANVTSVIPFVPYRQFPFIPRLTGSGEALVRVAGYEASVSIEYASRRYTTIDNIAALSSDPYAVVSVSLHAPVTLFGSSMLCNVFLDNLFDRSYEIVQNYPMPGRSVVFTASLEVK